MISFEGVKITMMADSYAVVDGGLFTQSDKSYDMTPKNNINPIFCVSHVTIFAIIRLCKNPIFSLLCLFYFYHLFLFTLFCFVIFYYYLIHFNPIIKLTLNEVLGQRRIFRLFLKQLDQLELDLQNELANS
jgi:hypothetical protein